jgi:hypothetical protein
MACFLPRFSSSPFASLLNDQNWRRTSRYQFGSLWSPNIDYLGEIFSIWRQLFAFAIEPCGKVPFRKSARKEWLLLFDINSSFYRTRHLPMKSEIYFNFFLFFLRVYCRPVVRPHSLTLLLWMPKVFTWRVKTWHLISRSDAKNRSLLEIANHENKKWRSSSIWCQLMDGYLPLDRYASCSEQERALELVHWNKYLYHPLL